MIKSERIVPILRTDYLSLIGTILALESVSYSVLKSSDVPGDFSVAEAGTYLADQPVKSLDFVAESGTVYFVADFAFKGFKVSGSAVETEVVPTPDAVSLYKAVLSSGTVTVTAYTP